MIGHRFALLVTALTVFGQSESAAAPTVVNPDASSAGYAVGYQVGSDFRSSGLSLDEQSLINGLRDALAGREPGDGRVALRATLRDLKRKVDPDVQPTIAGGPPVESDAARADDTRAPGSGEMPMPGTSPPARVRTPASDTAFLTENARRPGVLTLGGGLQVEERVHGAGPHPTLSDRVYLRYSGTLPDGDNFGSSASTGNGRARSFKVSALMPGVREAVLRMQAGSQWTVVVPPGRGFDSGNPLFRRTVIYDLTLEAIEPGQP